MRRNLFYQLGNILIVGSILLLIFTYYPIIKLYFPSSNQSSVYAEVLSNQSLYIDIPRIDARAPIVPNVNPWNPNDYLPALQRGVAEASGFATPGQRGTIFLFAHSSDLPWRMTRTNTAFFRLGDLKAGDSILIFQHGSQYSYTVKYSKEVWPDNIETIRNLSGNWLVLQTCVPIGTSLKRLLVFASPDDSS